MLRPGPLTEQHVCELLQNLAARDSRDAVARRILARTGGNPLVVELI